MEFKEILRDIISKDFDILKRRDEFLEAVKASATPKDFNALNRIELSIHILESFFVANSKSAEQKLELKKNLRKEIINNVGLQEKRANFILESFIYALGWDLDDDEEYEDKKIDNDTAKMKAREANANTWTCECGNVNSGKFCSECGKARPVANTWTCSCGNVNSGKFCSGCGKTPTNATPKPSANKFLQKSVDDIAEEYNLLMNVIWMIAVLLDNYPNDLREDNDMYKLRAFLKLECTHFEKKYNCIRVSNKSERFITDAENKHSLLWLIQIDDNRYAAFHNPLSMINNMDELGKDLMEKDWGSRPNLNIILRTDELKNIFVKDRAVCLVDFNLRVKPSIFVPDGDFWMCEEQGKVSY